MKEAAGSFASLVGTFAVIVGAILVRQYSEIHNTAGDWMIYGVVIVGGLALMIGGFYLAGPRALVVSGTILLLFFGWCAVYGPGFFTSPGRSAQKRSMADTRTLATALEARETETHEYPVVRKFDDLVPLLEPTYIKTVPRVDGWKNAWKYESWKEDPKAIGADHYALGSAGRDNKFDKPSLRDYTKTETTDFDGDVVYRDGEFISYPQGSQRQ